jgi:deoxyribodipyrimidine photo-lyase
MPSVAIALFTRDLRVHDNPVLCAAAGHDEMVPLFVLDDDALRGFVRPNRAAFLVQSLDDLDEQLRARGAALVVRSAGRRGGLRARGRGRRDAGACRGRCQRLCPEP